MGQDRRALLGRGEGPDGQGRGRGVGLLTEPATTEHPRTPRGTTLVVGAGSLLVVAALVVQSWCAWERSWTADALARPESEHEIPVHLVAGEGVRATITPSVTAPHLLYLEIDGGLASNAGGDCPVSVTWSVSVPVSSRAPEWAWRVGDEGRATVLLGNLEMESGAECILVAHVDRAPPEVADVGARFVAIRNDSLLENLARSAAHTARIAWIAFGFGVILLLIAWFRRSFRIRRRT